jgi:hypothetical protein
MKSSALFLLILTLLGCNTEDIKNKAQQAVAKIQSAPSVIGKGTCVNGGSIEFTKDSVFSGEVRENYVVFAGVKPFEVYTTHQLDSSSVLVPLFSYYMSGDTIEYTDAKCEGNPPDSGYCRFVRQGGYSKKCVQGENTFVSAPDR